MPLRRTINLNHLPTGTYNESLNAANFLGKRTDTTSSSAVNGNIIGENVVDEHKWFGSSGAGAYLIMNHNQMFVDNTKKSIFGYRAVINNLAQFRVGSVWSPSSAVYGSEMLASTINTGTLSSNTIVAGVECYIEVVYDWVNLTQTFRVDGEDKYRRTMTSAQMASWLTTYQWVIVGVLSTASVWWTKDWYFMDGATTDQPLGPIIVRPGARLTTGGVNFRAPNNDFVGALNTKYTGLGSDVYPNVQSTASVPGDLTSTFDIDYEPPTIVGVDPWMTARDQIATGLRTATPKATMGAQTLTGTPKVLTNLHQHNTFNGAFTQAPDSGLWTPAKLRSTSFTHSFTA